MSRSRCLPLAWMSSSGSFMSGRHLAVDLVEDHFVEAEDRVQGRPQLVAHAGEEFRLVAAGDLELAALVLDLVEQPHVLDRDHRLGGERFEELDLLVGERADFQPPHDDDADCLAFAHQRHGEEGPLPGCNRASLRVLLSHMRFGDVGDMHRPGVDYCATSQICTCDDVWRHDGNRTMVRDGAMLVAPTSRMTTSCAPHRRAALSATASNTGWVSVGELLMTFRISAVAVCCSSASVISALRACSSLNSRTFSIAITAWSAKVLSSATCLSVNGPGVARVYD